MINMDKKIIRLYILNLILISLLLFLSFGQVRATVQSNYTPIVEDVFTYSGSTIETGSEMQERIVNNVTTPFQLIDYYKENIEQKNIQDVNNVTIVVQTINPSTILTNLSVFGSQNAAGSYSTNDSSYYNVHDYPNWLNQTINENFEKQPFNQTGPMEFNYSTGFVPSSMIVGDNQFVYVGMPAVPFGSDEGGSGSGAECSLQDMTNYTIANSGEIELPPEPPFNDLTQFTLRGIFNASIFDRTVFDADNLAWLNGHSADNITWTTVDLGLISGINPSFDGMDVVLVYQLAINYGTGMLEADTGYCQVSSDTNPLEYFGDLSTLQLTWTNYTRTNRPFTINGYQFSLTTKTYQGTNYTSKSLVQNMPLGDSGIYADADLTLYLNGTIMFEFDTATGFMVGFSSNFKASIGMSINSVEIPLPNAGYNGTATVNVSRGMQSLMDFKLTKHTSLYQTPPSTSTISTTSTTITSQSQSKTTISTTDYPGYLLVLTLPIIIVIRKKYHK